MSKEHLVQVAAGCEGLASALIPLPRDADDLVAECNEVFIRKFACHLKEEPRGR